jgi:membrane associated rhomboid family serine protease
VSHRPGHHLISLDGGVTRGGSPDDRLNIRGVLSSGRASMTGPYRTLGFALLSAVVAAAVVYLLGPTGTGVVSSVAAGAVVFGMFAAGLVVANERLRQILVDILSLFP